MNRLFSRKRKKETLEYDIVIYATYDSDASIEQFVRYVNEKLAEGWTLQGGVCCYPVPGAAECILFCQAVVKIGEGQPCGT